MTALLDLSVDEVLSTTRAVRKRLDFDRPVPEEVIRECVRQAMQAPAGSNIPRTRFVVVRDADKRRGLAALYNQVFSDLYSNSPAYVRRVQQPGGGPAVPDRQQRVGDSVDYLANHLAEAPALVVACLTGMRVDGELAHMATTFLGQTCPAMWNFMLAARARGLGTCWTTMHLPREREAAELLGIPYDTVQQVCLTPLAYTRGTDFRPAARDDPETYIHWDGWDASKPVPEAWKGFSSSTTGQEDGMTDTEQISNVLSRYCQHIDDRDWDALAEVLAEDVRFEMGDVTESRQELFDYMKVNLWPAGRHVTVNRIVNVDGDSAHADSDWIWLDGSFNIAASGRYSDDFRRVDGRWILTVRRISMAEKATDSS